ncbi:uncharacterized protein [Aegilops tauschii subsp. strangulata]|uniref:uncharacterized protein n=1 Tax=Aegilops tauschii subsp. strangulata TaxID=200361 RepID=UPI003CC87A4B
MGESTHQSHHKQMGRGTHSADFNPCDATEILKIKVPRREVEDCVAWHYEKSGMFSVSSAYELAMRLKGTEENEYHAVVACTKSKALRHAMREHWSLPKEKDFWYTGEDWLQGILNASSDDVRDKILLLLWRAWYLRDDIVHGRGKESISASVVFLLRYEQEVYKAKDKPELAMNTCGLHLFGDQQGKQPELRTNKWSPPPAGMAKLNTDAAFEPNTGLGTGGAIARNNLGQVYLSMGCTLNQCASVEEAEGLAMLQGLREMAKYYNGPIQVEVD